MNSDNEPRSANTLYFDPDKHPEDTLKTFNEFCTTFTLRYNALYPDPPKVSLDAALRRWTIEHTTTEVPDPKPTLNEYDTVRNNWRSKDKVIKFLGLFSSNRFHSDWQAAQPDEIQRENSTWTEFLAAIRAYYKPTENATLKNFISATYVNILTKPLPHSATELSKKPNIATSSAHTMIVLQKQLPHVTRLSLVHIINISVKKRY